MSKTNNHKIQENELKINYLFKKLIGYDLSQPKGFPDINKSMNKIPFIENKKEIEKRKQRCKSEKKIKRQKNAQINREHFLRVKIKQEISLLRNSYNEFINEEAFNCIRKINSKNRSSTEKFDSLDWMARNVEFVTQPYPISIS